jgi:hypothetical protein
VIIAQPAIKDTSYATAVPPKPAESVPIIVWSDLQPRISKGFFSGLLNFEKQPLYPGSTGLFLFGGIESIVTLITPEVIEMGRC